MGNSNAKFRAAVKTYCAQIGWKYKMENSGAIIPFNDENDNTQVLFVTPYEECIEFFVPSKFRYDSMQEVPKMLAVKLLHKNSTLKIGAWTLKALESGDDPEVVLSFIANVRFEDLNSAEKFERMSRCCLHNVTKLEEAFDEDGEQRSGGSGLDASDLVTLELLKALLASSRTAK